MSDATTAATVEQPSIVVRDLYVTYRIYADRAPGLRKIFVGERQREYRAVEAVKGVTFDSFPGQAVGIIGHNGSGKSSLLRAMAGLLPATGGQVYSRSLPVLLGVSAALEPEISGRRNVYLGGTALGISRSELDERFDGIVRFAGLEDFIDVPLRAYSSGMKARLQFAIATCVTPDILMVDEALAVGDRAFKKRSDARIKEMMGEAGTVFIVSHSLKNITDICSRALWIDGGVLVMDGPAEEVVDAYQDAPDGRFQ